MSYISQKVITPLRVIPVLSLVLSLAISTPLSAHSGATGVTKERMDRMQTMKESMASIADMVKGKTPFLATQLEQQSLLILEASKDIARIFPPGSDAPPSAALPAIWTNWDQFAALSDRFDEQASKLASLADSGDKRAIKVQYAQLARACRACHTDYRKKKEQE